MTDRKTPPPDHHERARALDAARSALVQAPAGSGKTDLLTRRFLRLLSTVDEPRRIVAITFTKAAAAEMRHRILAELEKAAAEEPSQVEDDAFSMRVLARRALERSHALGWNLLDLPAQLRISTIDSFCRDLALQQPLLSGLGGGLEIAEQPADLYRRAARRTLEAMDGTDAELNAAIDALLLWRDNSWQEMEDLLVEMLAQRDRWMHDFVLGREQDWEALRERLERPFQRAVAATLTEIAQLLNQAPGAREEALALARFACEEPGTKSPWTLAECAEIPSAPFPDGLDTARETFAALASFLQTQKGEWRSEKGLKAPDGFPATPRGRAGKARFAELVAKLNAVPSLQSSLARINALPPARYTDEDWRIVRACFTLLRRAAAELQVVFAETAAVDFIEVAQVADRVMKGDNGFPADAALAVADDIHHLLVDEFQDTSRRQHQLLAHLIAAWPDRAGRTCFVVGDPMQSIYFFRDADAELFPRVRKSGLEVPHDQPLRFDPVQLFANFRTAAPLVSKLNDVFTPIFAVHDGSDVSFAAATAARTDANTDDLAARMHLHLEFTPQTSRAASATSAEEKKTIVEQREAARAAQTDEIVELVRSHLDRMAQARAEGRKYRIAILGRTRTALAPIATALRDAAIAFRAVDLEPLRERPEVLDALALARALLNPQDRVAWLGVLRAPWCGLSLVDLHALTSADDPAILAQPIPELLTTRAKLLSIESRAAIARLQNALDAVPRLRFGQPAASLGTWLEQVWLRLGGHLCVDPTARVNVDLLWRCLDRLPNGEPDLLGPALEAALDKLDALPDPTVEGDCGVQLMTIHKSKGLEFEIVLVPDLQAPARNTRGKMLSWLERGLAKSDDSGEITEFLVAPLQPKGTDRGKAKAWVDQVYRARESQEMRRILYVAATRAREELHLFARPAYKISGGDAPELAAPSNCLLATAWPALEHEVRERFDAWNAARAAQDEAPLIESLAAAGTDNLLVLPAPVKPTLLRRLPADIALAPAEDGMAGAAIIGLGRAYERHEGGLLSRALGTAVHALLQELARLREMQEWAPAQVALRQLEPRIAAQLRGAGLDRAQAARVTAQALEIAANAAQDANGQWILSPHTDAASEIRWAGVLDGRVRTVQADRIFRAGAAPHTAGSDVWWIVDYKTAHLDGLDPVEALPELRRLFAPQLETYAQVLRNLHGADIRIHAGLYYPRMLQFDWWES